MLKKLGLAGGLAVLVCAVDQLVKALVVWRLHPYVDYPVLGNFFKLTLVFNPNTVFGISLGKDFPYPVVIVGIMAMVVVALVLEKAWPNVVAYGLIIGGASGNLVDRFTRPGVVDFLNFGIGDLRWPYFNIADACVVSAILVIIAFSFRKKEDKAPPHENLPKRNSPLS